MKLDVAICLPQEAQTVALIRGAVTSTLSLFGVEDECVEDIRLALSEACTNVIEHAQAGDEYEVRVEVDDTQCQISVKNSGNGFDFAALDGQMPDGHSARGRGVAIMRAVMDQVRFSSEPRDGTIVHLVKQLDVRDGGVMDRLRRRQEARTTD
ncbi:MAG TPA: ATP-binding protein [Acidimicrobiales bacterium]|nr:ATP-binding protein [Acidimicrobiales bacterium]